MPEGIRVTNCSPGSLERDSARCKADTTNCISLPCNVTSALCYGLRKKQRWKGRTVGKVMPSRKRREKNPTSLTPEACQEDKPHVGSREQRVLCLHGRGGQGRGRTCTQGTGYLRSPHGPGSSPPSQNLPLCLMAGVQQSARSQGALLGSDPCAISVT